jgi:hypothetical protein
MSSEIDIRDAAAPTDPDSTLRARFENTINTPIVSISWLEDGGAIAGAYTVAATGASTVDITCDDPKNEHTQTGKTVVANGSTVNKDVVPGVGIVFSASLAAGWTAKVSVGALMDGAGATSRRLNVGTVQSGTTSTQRQLAARNVGTEDSSSSEVYALPGLFKDGTDVEDWIDLVRNHSSPSRHALATPGDYVLTFTDFQTGTPDTCDVWVNKDGGGAVKAIEDAKMDGTVYEHGVSGYIDGADALPGMAMAFVNDPGDPTSKTFTIYVREGDDWCEVAPDVSGSPGTWQSTPLTLTESGEATGVITASGHALFWFRMDVPSAAQPGDMRMAMLRARGLSV